MNLVVTALSFRLCAPEGGVNQGPNLTGVLISSANGSTPASPTPSAFTGGANVLGVSVGVWVSFVMFAALMGALLVL